MSNLKSLTIGIITSRPEPHIDWIMQSLGRQWGDARVPVIVVVDSFAPRDLGVRVDKHVEPKPSLWNGKHRATSQDWWAASSYRNTILCHAQTEWCLFLDDRCVVAEGMVNALEAAMVGDYAVFGTYEKRHFMEYENGVVSGELKAVDNRLEYWKRYMSGDVPIAMPSPASWGYGCCLALPTQWALDIGGFEEACDGLSAEDTAFSAMLQNNGHPMRFDPRMKVIQDRTPGQIGTAMRREDKGVSPLDKSHRSVELFHSAKNTSNRHQLLQSRAAVLRGEDYPVLLGPRHDWYDGEKIDAHYMKPWRDYMKS